MSQRPIDAEMLAAFIDGRLDPSEREEVMRALAADRALHAQFAEAVRIRAAYDEGGRATPDDAPSPPVLTVSTGAPSRARRAHWQAPVALVAAVLAIVLVVRGGRNTPQPPAADPLQVAHLTPMPADTGDGAMLRALGAGWSDPAWSVSRGNTVDDGSDRGATARAFRAGVRVAQLEMAAIARDPLAMHEAALQLQALLRDVDGASALQAALQGTIDEARVPPQARRTQLASQVRTLTGGTAFFDLGVWTESARVAARLGQLAFFDDAGPAMVALRALIAQDGSPDWLSDLQPLRELGALTQQDRTAERILRALDAVARAAGD